MKLRWVLLLIASLSLFLFFPSFPFFSCFSIFILYSLSSLPSIILLTFLCILFLLTSRAYSCNVINSIIIDSNRLIASKSIFNCTGSVLISRKIRFTKKITVVKQTVQERARAIDSLTMQVNSSDQEFQSTRGFSADAKPEMRPVGRWRIVC